MIEKIGANAGKVWSVLDVNGRQNVKEIKKASKLTDKDLYAALGWLAREGKVVFETVEKELFISLS
ncbi:MAG: winged helix-turn-helix domain-containing protein [Proteiniphilum sp.]|nr:winged helix-turn-helix domain-containing protein [Proteiniphilum sp.]MDD3908829.1 winged helix-turn-helix domain-containing protein [Proteiniphilum sp.]MDD4415836.1 winged helix-turn-helix domain-containing protein [Proteiniphilum sp.]